MIYYLAAAAAGAASDGGDGSGSSAGGGRVSTGLQVTGGSHYLARRALPCAACLQEAANILLRITYGSVA